MRSLRVTDGAAGRQLAASNRTLPATLHRARTDLGYGETMAGSAACSSAAPSGETATISVMVNYG